MVTYTNELDLVDYEISIRGFYIEHSIQSLYVVGYHDNILQFTYSDINSLSTHFSFDGEYYIGEGNWAGITFSANGDKTFIVNNSNHSVRQYTLSTPWDILSIDENTKLDFNLSSYNTEVIFGGNVYQTPIIEPMDLAFNPTGTKMFLATGGWGSNNPNNQHVYLNRVYEFSLAQAWDLSSVTFNDKNIDLDKLVFASGNITQFVVPTGIESAVDLELLYLVGNFDREVLKFDVPSWDLDQASLHSDVINGPFDITFENLHPRGLRIVDRKLFTSSGSKIYEIIA